MAQRTHLARIWGKMSDVNLRAVKIIFIDCEDIAGEEREREVKLELS